MVGFDIHASGSEEFRTRLRTSSWGNIREYVPEVQPGEFLAAVTERTAAGGVVELDESQGRRFDQHDGVAGG